MGWFSHSDKNSCDDIEDLAYPPSGGRAKMIALGILLPLVIAFFATRSWMNQEAVWFGGRGSGNAVLKGKAAQSMAFCYFGAACFCHFRWFWGLISSYRVFVIGISISMIIGLGGCGATYYYVFK